MSETTEELSTQSGENLEQNNIVNSDENLPSKNGTVPEGHADNSDHMPEAEDNLLELPPEKLAGMVRDKRKAEASVRSKLREAEAERDKLAGTVTGFRRQAFAATAAASKVQESAMDDVLGAVGLDNVLGEDGTVDAEKVQESLQALRRSHPHYFEPIPKASSIGQGGAPAGFEGASWSDVLR
ncbi:hypothetical protein CIK58_01525 [Brevibacterium aurantiacum]|uniref:hypothetical protein n=1 Tax=Brevibacterium aurantiacum TaxID=273384 RepID=UPI000BB8DF15|nr:hypothetical protein [Brevibacterium aurantiacum]PCC58646.1 hypothetical protein CIK58_01525 [Brevibacterium aurantiacum]